MTKCSNINRVDRQTSVYQWVILYCVDNVIMQNAHIWIIYVIPCELLVCCLCRNSLNAGFLHWMFHWCTDADRHRVIMTADKHLKIICIMNKYSSTYRTCKGPFPLRPLSTGAISPCNNDLNPLWFLSILCNLKRLLVCIDYTLIFSLTQLQSDRQTACTAVNR